MLFKDSKEGQIKMEKVSHKSFVYKLISNF